MAIKFSGGIKIPQGKLEFKVPVAVPPELILPQPSNVIFHIDPSVSSTVTLSGSNITQIDDLGPGGRDFIGNVIPLSFGGGASTFPVIQTAGQNDRDTMLFDGERNMLSWTGPSVRMRHLFVVAKNASSFFTGFDGLVNGLNTTILTGNLLGTLWLNGLGPYFRNLKDGEGTSNGNPINQFAVHSVSGSGGQETTRWIIGHNGNRLEAWNGQIAHVVAYDIQLGATDRDQVISDLMSRWGIV